MKKFIVNFIGEAQILVEANNLEEAEACARNALDAGDFSVYSIQGEEASEI